MKKILITGATGFVGHHLTTHLLSQDTIELFGTTRSEDSTSSQIVLKKVDLQKREEVHQLLKDIQPNEIYHLAAQSNVPKSFQDPINTFHTNIDSQINLFESLRDLSLTETKILLVSSAEVYGHIQTEDVPVDEETPTRPANPYAVSKLAQDYLGFQYALAYNLPIIRVRPFNHIGPGQSPGFVLSDFASQIAAIEKGNQSPIIRVGNLEARRDFTDVRDMVKLYPLLLNKGEWGAVYNAGAGISHSAQEILDILLSLTSTSIHVEQDPSRMRPSDVPNIVADISKVSTLTGWAPEIPFEQTVKDTLDYFRNVV